jgi:dienelactone hydrolase
MRRFFLTVASVFVAAAAAADVVQDYANSESTVDGVVAGSYLDTTTSDDVVEGLTERVTKGNPRKRRSTLHHEWTIDLGVAATSSTFFVEAYHTPNSEGDDFAFAYSVDGLAFVDMITVTQTSDPDATESFTLPAGLSGTVTVRVTDTDNSQGNSSADTLYVDWMYIESEGATGGGGIESFSHISYKTNSMKKSRGIDGYQPADPGTYPVFVWMPGTRLSYWSGDDQAIVQEMASRGFVAAAVDYGTNNKYPNSCSRLSESAAEIFASADGSSAINVIGSLAKADLAKGIVVAGFSQGGNLAALAKNFLSGVEAAYVIGHGYTSWGQACYENSATALPSERIRSVMGENDAIWPRGGDADANRIMLEVTTGISCGVSALSCPQANGSGWWLVQASETADGVDDHCFLYGSGFCGRLPFDTNFESGTGWWALPTSLDWLASWAVP